MSRTTENVIERPRREYAQSDATRNDHSTGTFNLGFFTQVRGTREQVPAEVYSRLTDAIVAADELGYESVWLGQHHFEGEWGRMPSPLVFLASVAAQTKRIQIGTAVSVLPFEDPLRLAEDAAVLDTISGGRVNIGLGGGSGGDDTFRAFGLTQETRRQAFDQKLDVLIRALEGQEVPADGSNRTLQPNAPGLRERLWHSVGSTQRAREAARAGNNLLIGSFHDHALYDQLPQIQAYLEEWQDQEHERRPRIGALRFVYWGRDKADVERLVTESLPRFQSKIGGEFPDLAAMDPADYLERVTRYGSPTDVVDSLRSDPALFGYATDFIPSFSLYPAAGETTLGEELSIENLEFFAREIAPQLGWEGTGGRD
ncbi:LLM class flavin-dependent oxidoreductase [Cellulosimicrobium funkei]|nr:LLM class flavin-dependent oxidoreductase [Cellulosimicrobium funkei]